MVLKIYIFSLLFIESLASPSRRIWYGEDVKQKLRFMACLVFDEGKDDSWVSFKEYIFPDAWYYQLICGASIFSEYWVLTAAHCLIEDNYFHYVGVNGWNFKDMEAYHEFEKKIPHPNFIYENHLDYNLTIIHDYDIGLVKTKTRINFLPSTRPNRNVFETRSVERRPLFVFGWGHTESGRTSETLVRIQLQHIPDCPDYEAIKSERLVCFITDQGYGGIAEGDSGSPVVMMPTSHVEDFSVGAIVVDGSGYTSDGIDYVFMKGANISYFRPWINEQIRNN